MLGREDDESDVPEEFTAEQGVQQDQELQKVQQENKARAKRERKDRLRRKAKRFSPEPVQGDEVVEDEVEAEVHQQSQSNNTEKERQSRINAGMLPTDIVNMLAAREKQVFLSDSEEETERKHKPKKKKLKKSGVGPFIILKERARAPGVQNSLDFLKRRKMQVARSSAVLDNADQALRLLSKSGLLNTAGMTSYH